MFFLSLMVDLPAENWSESPKYKNGPITRLGLIITFAVLLYLIYKDKDFIYKYYSTDVRTVKFVKLKYYLYNTAIAIFILYSLSHEIMDPLVMERYPANDVESVKSRAETN